MRGSDSFVIFTERVLSLFSFRAKGDDERNLALLEAINDDGRIYLTQTKVDGRIAIRFVTGQFDMTRDDIDIAYDTITELAAK